MRQCRLHLGRGLSFLSYTYSLVMPSGSHPEVYLLGGTTSIELDSGDQPSPLPCCLVTGLGLRPAGPGSCSPSHSTLHFDPILCSPASSPPDLSPPLPWSSCYCLGQCTSCLPWPGGGSYARSPTSQTGISLERPLGAADKVISAYGYLFFCDVMEKKRK